MKHHDMKHSPRMVSFKTAADEAPAPDHYFPYSCTNHFSQLRSFTRNSYHDWPLTIIPQTWDVHLRSLRYRGPLRHEQTYCRSHGYRRDDARLGAYSRPNRVQH